QRLEIEGGEKELDAVILWARERERALPSPAITELQRALTLQVTVPMAYYYRGIRHFLLGENAAATAELGKYLATLPDTVPSRAREFLAMIGPKAALAR
ncbi:MAG: hypothetical protein HYU76_07185, partial [Betaproteobacteria bacterium]|nr:hypothetical protein [Betaproteobacteria bacterium]